MARKKKIKGNYPVGKGKKGCLGRDGTYSIKNCKEDDYFSQGIGNG